ncbi:MAG: hypothetical protein IJZ82_03910 [Lachnospiraceae bacterium]|nr:hypothetical protein [Lachnospiraceae bacterium]
MSKPYIFGIRHLSPAGAWHLRSFLDQKRPRLVLIEGPSDFDDQMEHITNPATKTPIAILAYTKEAPVRTILYPFAEYSPEYQAILWCKENRVACRFMDLPSEIFLALPSRYESENKGEEERMNVYELLDKQAGEDGHDTFWERTLEHAKDMEGYHLGANTFGENIRELSQGQESDWPEILVREAYMRRKIQEAIKEGYQPEEIVVVTGAYHVAGLLDEEAQAMTDEELGSIPSVGAKHTLMPYSDYRLSTRSGYGAGNKAPAYYGILWEAVCKGDYAYTAECYLAKVAGFLRKSGNPVSSAEVIEAVRLADSLAVLRGGRYPALRDLRDAAVTCLGKGSFPAVSLAVADTEIGTRIGALPEGVSNTSIQEDFYRKLKELKLEKYRDMVEQDLALDLRENRNVSTQKAAFLDLHRSFFLHQLRILGICFARQELVKQDAATWAENWAVRWSPEAEIELVEAALKGDTVLLAASFVLKERVENGGSISDIAQVIEDAFSCGMAEAVAYATAGLQAMAVDAASITELAKTAHRLSTVLQYGNIRLIDTAPLVPILTQIFYRCCLILPGECICDDGASKEMVEAMEMLNSAVLAHDFLEEETWVNTLKEIADRDDLNTKLSGYGAAVLLERGKMDNDRLKLEVSRRLSKGVPADLGAGWFEGLAMKNRYGLIARLSLWESLDTYLETLDEEEFKRALVFLRRAFADFSAMEKDEIAENLGEIWGLNGQQVSEAVNATLGAEEQKMIESLDDFDFDF